MARQRRGDDDLGIADLKRMLAERVVELAAELLPGGRRHGRLWRAGSVAGEEGQSLALELEGPRRGWWRDYSDPQAFGDLIDLVAWTRTDRDLGRAILWARDRLGLGRHKPSPVDLDRIKQQTAVRERQAAAEARRRRENDIAFARRIWDKRQPICRGDVVDRYLKGRSIDLGALGRVPKALGHAPALLHKDSGRRFPAMLGAITDGNGELIGVHRTFLQVAADGRVAKAPVDDPKQSLGRVKGGSIKLWRPQGAAPWANMRIGSTVAVAEGIEDALAGIIGAEIAFPARRGSRREPSLPLAELRVVVAVSVGNIGCLELPAQVARVVILRQNDPPGSRPAQSLAQAIAALQAAGLEVLVLRVPHWEGIKDLADLVRDIGGGAALGSDAAAAAPAFAREARAAAR